MCFLGDLLQRLMLLYRYLYEREHYVQARTFIKTTLKGLTDKNSLVFASAIMLHGLIELDINNVETALESFIAALEIRQKVLHRDDAFIASNLNAISLAYTELGDRAKETRQSAINIRL